MKKSRLGILIPTFLWIVAIATILNPGSASAVCYSPGGCSGWSVPTGYGLPSGTIYDIVTGILTWILGILGFIGIIGFAISGIMYLVSAGNDDAVKKAKAAMKYSIIGVIVGLAGVVALQAVDNLLNARTF